MAGAGFGAVMPAYRYGPMCWGCRGFYWRVRPVGAVYLCNYCAFKARSAT